MRILFPVHLFFPTHFFGTETYTLELAKNLQSKGHDVVILTTTPYGEEGAGRIHSQYTYDGLMVHCLDLNMMPPHRRFKDIYYRPEMHGLLRDVISGIGPDLVHVTHLINLTAALLYVLREMQIPTVATFTDFYGICFDAKLEGHEGNLCRGPDRHSINCLCCYMKAARNYPSGSLLRYLPKIKRSRRLIATVLRHLIKLPGLRGGALACHILDVTERNKTMKYLYGVYGQIVAPSDFLYEAYVANDIYPARIHKINFGISLDLVKGYQTPRRKIDGRIRFGYIGQIAAHKGVDILIDAYLRVKGADQSLVIYGPDDQDRAYMDRLRKQVGGRPDIEFRKTFPRDELPVKLSDLDMLVIPSRWYENSPLVLLYALATRTPVTVTDVKGMTEFVKDNWNGYTFPMNDVNRLAAILQKVVDNPVSIERLSENAVYQKDTADHAKDVLALYERILATRGKHRSFE
jgi:glycosyltransferase involved in cell wall biosynthesis